MPVTVYGLLEDVETYEGKNGFGANITISTKIEKKTKRITFSIKDKNTADRLSDLLDTDISIIVELNQNNFGLRFGQILEIGA